MNLNKAELIGNLAADPVARTLRSGTELVSFTVATSYRYLSAPKEKKSETDFHAVVAYGKLGQIVLKYLKKGDKVYVDGRLKTVIWPGQGKARYPRTEIVANNLIMLGSAKSQKTNDEVVVEEDQPTEE